MINVNATGQILKQTWLSGAAKDVPFRAFQELLKKTS